jgi:hypothetical protein
MAAGLEEREAIWVPCTPDADPSAASPRDVPAGPEGRATEADEQLPVRQEQMAPLPRAQAQSALPQPERVRFFQPQAQQPRESARALPKRARASAMQRGPQPPQPQRHVRAQLRLGWVQPERMQPARPEVSQPRVVLSPQV